MTCLNDTFTATFLALREKLHRIALGMLLDDEDAKDALQDTYLRLHGRDDIVQVPPGGALLVAVLRNVCIDRLRRRRIRNEAVEIHDNPVQETEIEDMKRFEQLIKNGLTPLQLRIYDLAVAREMNYDEIALELAMSVEAVRTNMSRARKRIRENLKLLNR